MRDGVRVGRDDLAHYLTMRKILVALGVGSALALERVLRPAAVAEPKAPTGSRRVARDGYQGVERARGGGFMPAGETRADEWVHRTADQVGRAKAVVLAEEEAARASVPSLAAICRSTWDHRVALHAAGDLYFEGDGDMSDEAMEARYGPGWRELL